MKTLCGLLGMGLFVGFVTGSVPAYAGSQPQDSTMMSEATYEHPTCAARGQGCQVPMRGLGPYLPAGPNRETVHPTCAGRVQGCQVQTWRGLGLYLPAGPNREMVHPTCAGRGQGCQVPTWRGLGLALPTAPPREVVH